MDDFNPNNLNNNENKDDKNDHKLLNDINKPTRRKYWVEKGKNILNTDMFYIMLFICVCVIATTAVWVSKENVLRQKSLNDRQNEKIAEVPNPDENTKEVVVVDKSPKSTEDKSEKNTEDKSATKESEDKNAISNTDTKEEQKIKPNDKKETATKEVVNKGTQSNLLNEIILPVKGKVSLEYAKDTLVYSETLEQWTTHLGIDISSEIGNQVVAVLDGKVIKIEVTDTLGTVITIDHGQDIIAKYACVSSKDMVKVGQNVKKRQTISGIGNPQGFEIAQGPHLHFELIVNGESVNPINYLPQIK